MRLQCRRAAVATLLLHAGAVAKVHMTKRLARIQQHIVSTDI
jgi:hypothetical protein